MIVQNGQINFNAQVVPNAFVVIVPPSITQLNGVPTNIGLIVGSAPWGPVNAPQAFSDYPGGQRIFGPMKARKYDLLTVAAAAVQNGGNNFLGIRVTDGTDVAAAALVLVATPGAVSAGGTGHVTGDRLTLSNGAVVSVTASAGVISAFTKVSEPTAATGGTITQVSTTGVGTGFTSASWTYATGATITSKYTGSAANGDSLTIAAGSQASTYRVTIGRPGQNPEVFDNIGGAANAFWVNLAAAINNGQSGLRGPSDLVVAAAGAATAAPTLGTYTLAAGTDGSTVTPAMLLGTDGTTRTGLYAARSTGASMVVLADADDTTTWAAQLAFGLAEGMYMIQTGPAGQTPSQAATAKANAGIDSYAMKVLLGDWCYLNDTVNGQPQRLISPQGFALGRLMNLGPQESGLNKPIYGVEATQKSLAGVVYSQADLTILANAGIDVIAKPSPGGNYWSLRMGRNGSSNAAIHGDNYTRLTNYIARTLDVGVGRFVGQLQSPEQRADAQVSISSLFEAMASPPNRMIGNAQGTQPYQVILDDTNNPQVNVDRGIEQCDAKVQYLGIVETFVVTVEGGTTVRINRVGASPITPATA